MAYKNIFKMLTHSYIVNDIRYELSYSGISNIQVQVMWIHIDMNIHARENS